MTAAFLARLAALLTLVYSTLIKTVAPGPAGGSPRASIRSRAERPHSSHAARLGPAQSAAIPARTVVIKARLKFSPTRRHAIRFTEIFHGSGCEQLGRYKIPVLAGAVKALKRAAGRGGRWTGSIGFLSPAPASEIAPRLTAYCGPLIGFLLGTIHQTRKNFTINRRFCACVGQCFRLSEAIPALFCK